MSTLIEEEPGTETIVRPKRETQNNPKILPPYHVILLNDDHHTPQYVITMLQELFGFPVEKGFECAKTVHTQGRAILITTAKEHAELKQDQIHAYGPDPLVNQCKGSMSATIEPAN